MQVLKSLIPLAQNESSSEAELRSPAMQGACAASRWVTELTFITNMIQTFAHS